MRPLHRGFPAPSSTWQHFWASCGRQLEQPLLPQMRLLQLAVHREAQQSCLLR
jgi:hypothetical protein